jgi:formylmethanofuran dehydrogenase subunit E
MEAENPRREIEEAIFSGDLHWLLRISGMLHGHYCTYSALGVKAGARAMREMGVRKSTGMEEIIAIVETNNCFSDGVQMVTGCSFGNNALIFRDYGKTAFTLVRRNGQGLRIAVKPGGVEHRDPELAKLFRTVVVQRQGSDEEQERIRKAWVEMSFQLLDVPDEEVFTITPVSIEVPAYARIFASVVCSVCGENVMESRVRLKDGMPVCLSCGGYEYYQLAGDGMTIMKSAGG